jgi:hypothetical protein
LPGTSFDNPGQKVDMQDTAAITVQRGGDGRHPIHLIPATPQRRYRLLAALMERRRKPAEAYEHQAAVNSTWFASSARLKKIGRDSKKNVRPENTGEWRMKDFNLGCFIMLLNTIFSFWALTLLFSLLGV